MATTWGKEREVSWRGVLPGLDGMAFAGKRMWRQGAALQGCEGVTMGAAGGASDLPVRCAERKTPHPSSNGSTSAVTLSDGDTEPAGCRQGPRISPTGARRCWWESDEAWNIGRKAIWKRLGAHHAAPGAETSAPKLGRTWRR